MAVALNTMEFRKKQYMVHAYNLKWLTVLISIYCDKYWVLRMSSNEISEIKMLVSNYMQSKLIWKWMDTIENSMQRVETKIWWSAHTEAREMTKDKCI